MRCAETKRLRGEATGALSGEFLRFAPAGNLARGWSMYVQALVDCTLSSIHRDQLWAPGCAWVRLGFGWQQLLVE